jgi:4-hydroxybenzoate polyprenyltransferase
VPQAPDLLQPRPSAADFVSLVKFEHTLFALPFALFSAVLASGGLPGGEKLLWILVAMVGARSAAMAFNRIVDRRIDAANPRTVSREIPAGTISVGQAALLCGVSSAVFVLAAWRLNPLCLALSPAALGAILGYSFTKRFTSAAHVVLGLSLAIAPVGAWVAVRGTFAPLPVVLGLAVLFWVAGFDVIYSLQDEAFDRSQGLRSIPAAIGVRRALLVAAVAHALALGLFFAVYVLAHGGPVLAAGVIAAGAFLVRQHLLVQPGDLSRVNAAFFTANGWLSVVFSVLGIVDVLVSGASSR